MRQLPLITGADPARTIDALFVNAPLRDYDRWPRTNDYTLPVLGMAYIATYAQHIGGFNVGVLDAEAHGLGIEEAAAKLVNDARPRWAAMNLLMDYRRAMLAFVPEGEDRNALLGRVEGAIADVSVLLAGGVPGRRGRARWTG